MLCCTRQPVKTCTEPSSMRTGKCTVSSRLTSRSVAAGVVGEADHVSGGVETPLGGLEGGSARFDRHASRDPLILQPGPHRCSSGKHRRIDAGWGALSQLVSIGARRAGRAGGRFPARRPGQGAAPDPVQPGRPATRRSSAASRTSSRRTTPTGTKIAALRAEIDALEAQAAGRSADDAGPAEPGRRPARARRPDRRCTARASRST